MIASQLRLPVVPPDLGKIAACCAGIAVSAIKVLPADFFITGTSAHRRSGTILKGYLDEDVPVVFAGTSTKAPLVARPVQKMATATEAEGGKH